MLVDLVRQKIYEGFKACDFGDVTGIGLADVQIETPKNKTFGDYATNLPMTIAKNFKKNPREVAEKISANIGTGDLIKSVEIAGPGFLNIRVEPAVLQTIIHEASEADSAWGRNNYGDGARVQIEFVSANPTGPLSVGHGRLAAFGDALARVMDACGYSVQKEFYINDVGNQIQNLAMSVDVRYREEMGEEITLGETGYQGEYVKDYAIELKEKYGDELLKMEEAERYAFMADYTMKRVLEEQAQSLERYGVVFDRWFHEKELYDAGLVDSTLELLKTRGAVFEKEDALWFETTKYFDTQDRVLKKSSGIPTYFLSDIAYHKEKFDRGFDIVIDIWGADHHGYIPRMKSSVKALGLDPERLEILIVQLVRFKQSGFLVRMSKRAGNFITLSDLDEEVGADVSRFFFLMRTRDSHLDFDLELAKEKSEANPMFYLQYANARICTMIKKAEDQGMKPDFGESLSLLKEPMELLLMKRVADFPWEMQLAGASREPHRIISFLTELAGDFHSFYHDHRVLAAENPELSSARLALCAAVRSVFRGGLSVLGISAPESM